MKSPLAFLGRNGQVFEGPAADASANNQALVRTAAKQIGFLALTASRALVSDASGGLSASSVTATQLGYVAGVTSSIQTQLDAKAPLVGAAFSGRITLPAGSAVSPSVRVGIAEHGVYSVNSTTLGLAVAGLAVGSLTNAGSFASVNDNVSDFPNWRLTSYRNAGGPSFVIQRARGTLASAEAVQSGDIVGYYTMQSHSGAAFVDRVRFAATATENHGGSNGGTSAVIEITPNGTTTRQAILTLTGNMATFAGSLDASGDTIRLRTSKTPVSAAATGSAGEICWDASYIYLCTATNTWRRIAHSTW